MDNFQDYIDAILGVLEGISKTIEIIIGARKAWEWARKRKEQPVDKYYWGQHPETGEWQLFAADDPKEATPEASGYRAVDGPYDTREEAEENNPNG